MGAIIFWTIIRFALVIPALWFISESYSPKYFIVWSAIAIYLIVIHPAIVHYNKFEEESKVIVTSTLCSSCRNFDKTAVLCMKYDKHPTADYIPCDGIAWEPGENERSKNEHIKEK